MTFGLGLFAAVGLVSAIGSVLPAWGEAVYQSWWFAALLASLVANTGLCTIRQTRGLLRGSWRLRAVWLVHLSVLVLAAACGGTVFFSRSETVTVPEGGAFAVGGESWTLKRVQVEHYPGGGVSDWVSLVTTPRGPVEIRVNHPAETGERKVLQSGYQKTYRVTVALGGQSRTFGIDQDVEAPLTADKAIGFALSPPQDGLLARAQREGGSPEIADLLLTSRGRVLQRTAVFVGLPLDLGDTGLRLTVEGVSARSTFLVRQAPGLAFVWAAFVLLAVSITILVLIPRQPPQEASRA